MLGDPGDLRVRRVATGRLAGEVVVGSVLDRLLVAGRDIEAWFSLDGELLKDDGAIQVRLLPGQEGEQVFAKRFMARSRLDRIKARLGRRRGPHLWRITRAFQRVGLPVPAPLGYLRGGGRDGGPVNYFFGEALAGHRDLLRIAERRSDFVQWLTETDLMARIGQTFATMHEHGLTHGDTKWSNLAVDEETGRYWLLDLDGARRSRRRWARRMRKDLARFQVSAMEGEVPDDLLSRFVAAYSAARRFSRQRVMDSIKPLAEGIMRRHDRQYGRGPQPGPGGG